MKTWKGWARCDRGHGAPRGVARSDSSAKLWYDKVMRKTIPLTVTLTPKMAKAVKARVASGDYASESEVIRDGLRALEERHSAYESELDRWLRAEGKKRAKALEADETKLIPLDEAFDHLQKRARKRAQKKK